MAGGGVRRSSVGAIIDLSVRPTEHPPRNDDG